MRVEIRKEAGREEKELVRKGVEENKIHRAEGCSKSENRVESNEVEEGSRELALTKCV